MSRRFLLASVIVLVFCSAASAVDFRVEFNSRFFGGGQYIPGGRYFTIDIYMNNTDAQRNGFSIPLCIYGPQNDGVERIYWVNAGGLQETGGSVQILNGFGPDGDRFLGGNEIHVSSWDGILPDTINHTTWTTSNGWQDDEGELLVYRFHASTDYVSPLIDYLQLCIDSIAHSDPSLDWLWQPASGPFGGPYCTMVADIDCDDAPRFVSGCPSGNLDINWGTNKKDTISMEVSVDLFCDPGNKLSGASANLGNIVITDSIGSSGGGASVDWSFDAGYDMLGSYDVQLLAIDKYSILYDHEVIDHACNFTLNIINTPPTVTANCGDTIDCCIGTSVKFPFQVTDINTGDYLSYDLVDDAGERATISGPAGMITFTDDGNDGEALYEVLAGFSDRAEDTTYCNVYFNVIACCGDVNADGDLNLLDVLFLIDHVYGTPSGPEPGDFAQGDVVTDGLINLIDILYLIDYIYGVPTGPAPPRCM